MTKSRPGGMMTEEASLRQSDLLPFLNRGKDVAAKGFIGPVAVTLIFGLILFAVKTPSSYRVILGTYLSLVAMYVTYRLCGKEKPTWVFLGPPAVTAVLMITGLLAIPALIMHPLSGTIPDDPMLWQQWNYLSRIWRLSWGVGVPEELLKAGAVFLAVWLGRRKSPQSGNLGVHEPLDGILIGAASAIGFVMVETLQQYGPEAIKRVSTFLTLQQNWGLAEAKAAGEVYGLQVVIPRMLTMLSGHVAWAGYFGYFIGMSVMRPRHQWALLGAGLLTSAFLHGLWDATNSSFLQFIIGIASYALLAGAIIKARQVSPTRADNFATQMLKSEPAAAAPAAFKGPALRLGNTVMQLEPGTRLAEEQIGGLESAGGDGIVAVVQIKPGDASVLGLKNASRSTWNVTLPGGEVREVPPERSIRIDRGSKFDFGIVIGRVE